MYAALARELFSLTPKVQNVLNIRNVMKNEPNFVSPRKKRREKWRMHRKRREMKEFERMMVCEEEM